MNVYWLNVSADLKAFLSDAIPFLTAIDGLSLLFAPMIFIMYDHELWDGTSAFWRTVGFYAALFGVTLLLGIAMSLLPGGAGAGK